MVELAALQQRSLELDIYPVAFEYRLVVFEYLFDSRLIAMST